MGAIENEPERRVAPRMPPPKAAPVKLLRPVGPAPVPNGVKATDGLHIKTEWSVSAIRIMASAARMLCSRFLLLKVLLSWPCFMMW